MTNYEVFIHGIDNDAVIDHWPVDINLNGEMQTNGATESLIFIGGDYYTVIHTLGVPDENAVVFQPDAEAIKLSKMDVLSILGQEEYQDEIDKATAEMYDEIEMDRLLAEDDHEGYYDEHH